jgi:hypothetical protein
MPAAVGAAVVSVATGAGAAAGAAGVLGSIASGLATAALSMAASFVLNGALSSKKPKSQSVGPISRSEVIRQTVPLREYVYGATKKSGALIYHYTSGDNKYHYMAIAVASHQIESIDKISINEVDIGVATHMSVDSQYTTTGITHYEVDKGLFKDHAWIDIGLGSTSNQANKRFVAECTFSSTDTGEGVAIIYCKFKYNQTIFSGVPNIQVEMKGKNDIVDTRDSSTAYTTNASLVHNDYLKDSVLGIGLATTRIDTDSIDTAADVDDESVAINDRYEDTLVDTVTGSSQHLEIYHPVSAAEYSGANFWTSASGDSDPYIQYQFGTAQAIRKLIVSDSGRVSGNRAPTSVTLLASNTGAFAGEETTITTQTGLSWTAGEEKEWTFANGSSYTYYRASFGESLSQFVNVKVVRMQKIASTESRYTINGVFDSSSSGEEILEAMSMAHAGLQTYTNGKVKLLSGEYQIPALTITEDEVLTPMSLSRPGKKDKFNAVRGVYIKETQDFKPTDFPHITNSTYETEDGERIYKDLELPFTLTESAAQRIAKIQLERNRQDITCEFIVSIDRWDTAAGDTIMFTYSPWGFSSKVFDVVERGMVIIEGEGGAPIIGVRLLLRETASTVYTWSQEETTVDPAPNTNLPNLILIDPPEDFTLDSTEDQLLRGNNGRLVTRIKCSWSASENVFVTDGGNTELQYKKSSDLTWQSARDVIGSETFGFIVDVDDRETYDVRVRFRNIEGFVSEWTTESSHIVIGKTTPPPRVQDFVAGTNGINIAFAWTELSVLDVRGYEIRYGPQGAQWKDATPVETEKQGNAVTSSSVPPGTWSFLIKAIDAVGLYSNVASVSGPVTVSNANSVLNAVDDGEFPGTLDNFVLHYTGVLVPDDQYTASFYDWEWIDQAVPNPYATCTYTSDEVDLLSDQNVRVWGNITSALMPGETTGTANPKLQVCYRSSTDSSSGAESTTELIDDNGTYTNCIRHYTGAIVPDSQSLASVDTWDIFDEFVYDPYDNCTYEAAEVDFGSDGNVNLTLAMGTAIGPGETGTPDATSYIDHKTSSGSYDGFEAYTSGTINARYYKARIEWNNSVSVSYISDFDSEVSCWRTWVIGEVANVQYVQARIVEDTTQGIAKITGFEWTIDS